MLPALFPLRTASRVRHSLPRCVPSHDWLDVALDVPLGVSFALRCVEAVSYASAWRVGQRLVGGRLMRSRFVRFPSFRRASSSAFGTARTCFTNSSNLARGSRFGFGVVLPKGFLPDQLPVGDSLPDDSRGCGDKPRRVRHLARVEAIRSLVQIAVKVLGIDGVMSPVDHPLEQRPEVFKAVSVNAVPNVGFRVIDDLVDIVGVKPPVRIRRVRIDRRPRRNACSNFLLQSAFSDAWDDPRANLSVALKQAHCAHQRPVDRPVAGPTWREGFCR